MSVPLKRRSTRERREAIRYRLIKAMASKYGRDEESISPADNLGEAYQLILSDVVQLETGSPLKRFGPMRAESTFTAALEFLMTAIQS